jgi:glycosyltransferase involved in cell wall biosynthesis
LQNRRKHILFLSSWYPNQILRDNGDFIQRHAQAIALMHDVTVVHAIKDPALKSNKFKIEQNLTKGVNEIIVYCKPSLFKPFNLLYLLQAFLVGLKMVKPFHLVHLNVVYPAGLIAIYLNQKFKKPIILTEHWSGLQSNNFNNLPLYKRWFIRKILKQIQLVLPVSHYLETAILKINPNLKSKVIPNVVDLDIFNKKETKSSENSTKQFLHISNLKDEVKNVTGILNVVNRLAKEGLDFEFLVGGNGDLKFIESFIEKHKLQDHISVFGRLERKQVAEKMSAADCFILFSRYENQPCVQVEAFASGLPLIASNVGGVADFFPENFGVLVQSENEEDLYQAMLEVINKKSFASPLEMHHYAKDNFSKEEIANQYHKVYQEILK